MVNLKPFCGIILLLSLVGCRCDPPVVIDLGPVPDSILASVPYQDGQSYSFRHSAGQAIQYTVRREVREELTWCEWRCCDSVYKYQVVTTTLKPDYPVFDMAFSLSSFSREYPMLDVWIARSSFMVPLFRGDSTWPERADSLLIGDRWFRDVYRLGRYDWGYGSGTIYADSLFYNFNEGILRILMSNKEYYEIDK